VSDLDPGLVARGWAALGRMEAALAASPYLVGRTLSLADIALVAYTRMSHEGGFGLDNHPAIRAWVGRVEQALKIG
jgi:glutathione S-transferase